MVRFGDTTCHDNSDLNGPQQKPLWFYKQAKIKLLLLRCNWEPNVSLHNGWTAQWRGRRGWRSPAPSWADERPNEPNRLLFSNSKSVKQSASILDESRDGRRRHGAELRAPLALTVPELVASLDGWLPLNEKKIIAGRRRDDRLREGGTMAVVTRIEGGAAAQRVCSPCLPASLSQCQPRAAPGCHAHSRQISDF